ncbi:MAG: DUF2299 family protein [Blastocatellia bacterium]
MLPYVATVNIEFKSSRQANKVRERVVEWLREAKMEARAVDDVKSFWNFTVNGPSSIPITVAQLRETPSQIMLLVRLNVQDRDRDFLRAISGHALEALATEIELRVLGYGTLLYKIDEPPVFQITIRTAVCLDGLTQESFMSRLVTIGSAIYSVMLMIEREVNDAARQSPDSDPVN